MKKIYIITLFTIFSSKIDAQIGSINILDNSVQTAGITKIEGIDIDNDGYNEIITSTTGNSGRLGFYRNLTNSTFSEFNLIESNGFCRGFATGDFNNDGFPDIISIGGTNQEVRIHMNISGSYASSIILDTNNSILLNDVVVADFDNDSFDDFVVIGQHSIDFYRSDGTGSFDKEAILTTGTSPRPLECLDLAAIDLDNDGDVDLVCGETAGLVTYINDGNGIFTPHYHSLLPEIFFLIHPFDIDNDGNVDIIGKNSANQIKWFRNDGLGNMTFTATLPTIPNIKSLTSIDYNNDGLQDIYASYQGHISIFENNINHTFTNEIPIYQDNNMLMGVVQTANIDNQNELDYVWTGGTNTIAFHINQVLLKTDKYDHDDELFSPNPINDLLYFTSPIDALRIYNLNGSLNMERRNINSVDLSNLKTGVYIMTVENNHTISNHKIIKK